MSRPIEKITVLNRKKGSKQHVQKGSIANSSTIPENGVRNSVPTASSKENLLAELPPLYDGNHIETLVSEERTKHLPFASISPSAPNYEILKSPNGEVDFGGGNCGEFHNGLPRIVDLCLEDKKRILQLINELANCKEEKEIMTKELTKLKELVQQQMNDMTITSEKFAAQKEALALEVENLVSNRDCLSSDLENLQNCIEIQKNEIEKQASCIAALKSERKQLQKQLTEQENKLKAALSNVDTLREKLLYYEPKYKMKNEYMLSATPKNIDSQMSSCIHGGEKPQLSQLNDIKVNETSCCMNSEDIQKREEWDQLLISELFFRSKDVPEMLEPIFFKTPCHAQPVLMWDSLL